MCKPLIGNKLGIKTGFQEGVTKNEASYREYHEHVDRRSLQMKLSFSSGCGVFYKSDCQLPQEDINFFC